MLKKNAPVPLPWISSTIDNGMAIWVKMSKSMTYNLMYKSLTLGAIESLAMLISVLWYNLQKIYESEDFPFKHLATGIFTP